MKRPNPLIKILAGVVAVVIAGAIYISSGSDSKPVQTNTTQAKQKSVSTKPIDPDGDTTSEDVRKLAANLQQLKDTVGGLNDKINLLSSKQKGKDATTMILKDQVESIASGDKKPILTVEPNKTQQAPTLFGDLGDKINGIVPPVKTNQSTGSVETDSDPENIVWIQSADHGYDESIGNKIKTKASQNLDIPATSNSSGSDNTPGLFSEAKSKAAQSVGLDAELVPRYTIPDQSIIANATNITALIGRIPTKGQVQDPWRFKIATGKQILMPNGHYLDGLQKTFIEGTAVGDLNLRCVTGKIEKMTFIFDDGTIVTKKADNQKDGMGYISDDHATPCIAGELITNAPQAIAQLGGLGTASGLLQSIADNQKTTQTYSSGSSSTILTGDQVTANTAAALSQGSQAIQKWLSDRLQQYFDVIFVPAGKHLDVHIEQEIKIDYDPIGRKIKYANSSGSVPGGMD